MLICKLTRIEVVPILLCTILYANLNQTIVETPVPKVVPNTTGR